MGSWQDVVRFLLLLFDHHSCFAGASWPWAKPVAHGPNPLSPGPSPRILGEGRGIWGTVTQGAPEYGRPWASMLHAYGVAGGLTSSFHYSTTPRLPPVLHHSRVFNASSQ